MSKEETPEKSDFREIAEMINMKQFDPTSGEYESALLEESFPEFKKAFNQLVDYVASKEVEADQFAIDFAEYMDTRRWRYDHQEQKTHTFEEHLAHFKAMQKHLGQKKEK